MGKVRSAIAHAWNAFVNEDTAQRTQSYGGGASYGNRYDRTRLSFTNERSIIAAIYARLAIDVASVDFRHVRLDDDKQYLEDIDSGLNSCLSLEANLDQSSLSFMIDAALTIFDKGVAALVPVDTTINPSVSGSFDIKTMRVGEITAWYPKQVRVSLYNDDKGIREEILLDKKFIAIVENPLYSVMNQTNSTLNRLISKLNLLDAVDEQASSGKLDIIIQLPYVIKSEARRAQAEQRRKDIEFQLKGSKYGIAYADGTEKITQLNRPAENNLLEEVDYLTKMLYSQLGLTEDVMNGTADEATMLNYINRTIRPTLEAIVLAMRRAFLTKTARSQNQSVMYFRDPFKLVPIKDLADIVDKFSRNEVATANDFRAVIGWKPSKDPKANQLINSNMPQPLPPGAAPPDGAPPDPTAGDATDASAIAQGAFGDVNKMLDSVFAGLGIDENAVG